MGSAILAIFRVLNLVGWTPFMYNYMDATGMVAAIYFPLIVVVGNFFILKLFLAVIMSTFSELKEKIEAEEENKLEFERLLKEKEDF